MPTRLAAASTAKHACAWDGISHTWKPKDGNGPTIRLVNNGTWMPGADFTAPRSKFLPPRGLYVERNGSTYSGHGEKFHDICMFDRLEDFTDLDPRTPNELSVVGYGYDLTNPGEQGGHDIDLHPPAELSYTIMDCTIARCPVALYHTATGAILTRENALSNWFEYSLSRKPGNNAPGTNDIQVIPHFLRKPVGDPFAWSVVPHDEYHLCRAFMHALGLWRRDQDPVARWFINTLAEDARVCWTTMKLADYLRAGAFSLESALAAAKAAPHKGGRIVRGVAWVLRLGVANLEVGTSNAAEWKAWVAAMVTYCELVQLPCGAFHSAPISHEADQGEPWYEFGLADNKQECPSWQVPFLIVALWEAQKQIPRLRPRVVEILRKAKKLWSVATPRVPGEDGSGPGLPRYLVTAIDGMPVPLVTEGVGPARAYYDSYASTCFEEAGLGAL